ncbi:hypothetical protein V8F33_008996 [Rhypophila sp. PSN 637]
MPLVNRASGHLNFATSHYHDSTGHLALPLRHCLFVCFAFFLEALGIQIESTMRLRSWPTPCAPQPVKPTCSRPWGLEPGTPDRRGYTVKQARGWRHEQTRVPVSLCFQLSRRWCLPSMVKNLNIRRALVCLQSIVMLRCKPQPPRPLLFPKSAVYCSHVVRCATIAHELMSAAEAWALDRVRSWHHAILRPICIQSQPHWQQSRSKCSSHGSGVEEMSCTKTRIWYCYVYRY